MLSATFILENIDKVKEACLKKGVDEKVVDRFARFDKQRKNLLAKIQQLRADRNKLTRDLQKKPDKKTITAGKKLKKEISQLEGKLKQVQADRKENWLLPRKVKKKTTRQSCVSGVIFPSSALSGKTTFS